jgi:glutathionylspermidine synthase
VNEGIFCIYLERRRDFYQKLAGAWPQAISDPFDILDPYPLDRAEISNIASTASAFAKIYKSFLTVLSRASDCALSELGVPPPLHSLVRAPLGAINFPFLSRVDLVRSQKGYKVLEINSDAPGFLIEAFPVTAAANEHIGGINPNSLGEKYLTAAVRMAAKRAASQMGRPLDSARVAFSACDTFGRDREVALYLMNLLDDMSTTYVPFEQLRGDRTSLRDANGEPIDIVFRIFSLRAFAANISPFSPSLSATLLARLINDGKLVLVNAPLGLLMECKSIQAAIWGLRSSRAFFTAEQQVLIESIMLPTFLDLSDELEQYVSKPTLGFNGDTITIVDRRTGVQKSSTAQSYVSQSMIYQQFVDLPTKDVMTEYGLRKLSFLTSCFLVEGEPCGVILRAGTGVTNFDWWLVPVTETGSSN